MDREPDPPSKTLVFQGVLTEDDVVAIWRYVDRLQAGSWLRRLVFGLTAFTIALLLWAVALSLWMGLGMPWYLQAAVAVASLLLAYPLLGRDSGIARLARRYYRRHATRFLKTEVTLAADRVAIINEALRSELRWSLVGLVASTPAGLLFCNEARQPLFWLPERVLEDDHRSDVLALAEAQGVRVRRIE